MTERAMDMQEHRRLANRRDNGFAVKAGYEKAIVEIERLHAALAIKCLYCDMLRKRALGEAEDKA